MRSMTGYGSAEGRVGNGVLFAEVRSVNSRFLDVNCKIPPQMYAIEPNIRKLIQNNVVRGKVEVFLKEKKELAESFELIVNEKLVRQYKKCLNQVTNMIGLKASSHLLEVVDLKDLLVARDRSIDITTLWKQMERVILTAIQKHAGMRSVEGVAIKRDQLKRLAIFDRLVSMIEKRSNIRIDEGKRSIMHSAPSERRDSELVAISDKMDITEEVTRLKSHTNQYRNVIAKDGPVGRQVDFLLQEMHREINTLGSKSADGKISGFVVEAKTEIEKLREQVQNIE